MLREWFRHECRVDTLGDGHLPDHHSEGHDVVRHGQCIRVAKIDLVLPRRPLMMAEFYGDTHLLQHCDGVASEIGSVAEGGVIEVATVVEGNRRVELAEQKELDLRMDVEGEPQVSSLLQGTFQHVPRIGEARGSIRQLDVAQHPGCATIRLPPRQHLES